MESVDPEISLPVVRRTERRQSLRNRFLDDANETTGSADRGRLDDILEGSVTLRNPFINPHPALLKRFQRYQDRSMVRPDGSPPPVSEGSTAVLPDDAIVRRTAGITSIHVPSTARNATVSWNWYSTGQLHSLYQAEFSDHSSLASFKTAETASSYWSAKSTIDCDIFDGGAEKMITDHLAKLRRDYKRNLDKRNLVMTMEKELNWSGKGQHVVFEADDSIPLTTIRHLGASHFATVDEVLCRRIALARKLMRCTRVCSIVDALAEVEHLHRLRHFHIIQLVGTYLQGRNFVILMYPSADCHLGTFLEDTADLMQPPANPAIGLKKTNMKTNDRQRFLASSLGCLASAVTYIHRQTTKHMDIKPANIVVREAPEYGVHTTDLSPFRIYITDFGLSRVFPEDQSQTDGLTARTPKYCAPEVYDQEPRGRAADIFSLGCVFLETLSVYCGWYPNAIFAEVGCDETVEQSFRTITPDIPLWIDELTKSSHHLPSWVTEMVVSMLQRDSRKRPTADQLFEGQKSYDAASLVCLQRSKCCNRDPEPYIAHIA